MHKEKSQIPDYWYGVISILTPIIVSTSLVGFLGWLYRGQVFQKTSSIEPPTRMILYTPPAEPIPTQTLVPPTPEISDAHPPAHLFYLNGQYFVCNPVTNNATTTYTSLSEYGVPTSPFQVIVGGTPFEPTSLNDEIFSLMGKDDFACLRLVKELTQ